MGGQTSIRPKKKGNYEEEWSPTSWKNIAQISFEGYILSEVLPILFKTVYVLGAGVQVIHVRPEWTQHIEVDP